jgi:formate hydrogenlyase subunit 6/NADH:ubiquinone oxidoreductase subunit I
MAGAVQTYFRDICDAATTIFDGMTVTLANLIRKPTTIQYPDRTDRPVVDTLPERYRGLLEVDLNRCTACRLCETTCPIDCIFVRVEKNAEGVRGITAFAIDEGKCMFCGLCVEPCATGALRVTREFEGATERLDDLVLQYVPDGAFVIPAKAKAALETPTPERGVLARRARDGQESA